MSQRVGTPVNQVRHTNVATVRIKKKGKPFEVACYRNKVLSWRSKMETDLDEVLQIDNVFSNVSKGKLANSKDILACFDTNDNKLVIKEILEKGELQITDQERHAMQESTFRDVAAIVADKCINPENNRPYTVGMIKNAMKQIHYGVNLTKSAKSQALDVIKKLKATMPIVRAPMSLRVSFPAEHAKYVLTELNSIQGIILSTMVYDSSDNSAVFSPSCDAAGEGRNTKEGLREVLPLAMESAVDDKSNIVQSCKFNTDPDSYRRIQACISKLGSSSAFVEVLSLNAATSVAAGTLTSSAATEDVNIIEMAVMERDMGEDEEYSLADSAGDDREEWMVEAVEGMVLGENRNNKKKAKRRAKLEEKEEREGEKEEQGEDDDYMEEELDPDGREREDVSVTRVSTSTGRAVDSESIDAGKNKQKSGKQGKKAKRAEKEKCEQQETERNAMKARLEQEKVRQAEIAVKAEGPAPGGETSSITSSAAVSGDTKACTTCGGAFDKAAYREHFRSEWHRCNLKRKMEGHAILSEEEFLSLSA